MTKSATLFGVHAGLQHTSIDELRSLWRKIEALGFDWISIWDHFYAATGQDDPHCLEAVATHAALACETTKVRCGSLVYSVGYRHPAVLAKMICTIDQMSNGRAEIGLGAGWSQIEYNAYGIPFPSAKVRLDQLEEAVQCVRGLLRDEVTNFSGTHFSLTNAKCEPRPVQKKLPIWIGGGGEKRTLKIAARYADGWNVPLISPDAFGHKRSVLHDHCQQIGRDPNEITCAINVGVALTEESLVQQFGALTELVRPGVLTGSDQQIVDRIGEYVAAGADRINLSIRAPFDIESLERFSASMNLV
ncbi:MAG: TIGR03560 family F420-dependent LLM class oxidoreductase [Ilumatobacteraceae bacterium]